MDVEFTQTAIFKELQQMLVSDEQSNSSKQYNNRVPKGLLWILIGVLVVFSIVLAGISAYNDTFFTIKRLKQLELPFLVSLFNYVVRKLLYYFTSAFPAPERDSTRLWFLIFLNLAFFLLSMMSLAVFSTCFPTDFGIFVFNLFVLTFFFDVIFPFYWYKFRSSSISFEKPLFDLPLSQAKVFYYHFMSFTAQFYIPTFALVSIPLVYLYGKYLSYSLRKCSRLPSATYTKLKKSNEYLVVLFRLYLVTILVYFFD
ncbi:hypothetical protein GEMRC1_005035 [Eukaryota sp. GEM-RC1]